MFHWNMIQRLPNWNLLLGWKVYFLLLEYWKEDLIFPVNSSVYIWTNFSCQSSIQKKKRDKIYHDLWFMSCEVNSCFLSLMSKQLRIFFSTLTIEVGIVCLLHEVVIFLAIIVYYSCNWYSSMGTSITAF